MKYILRAFGYFVHTCVLVIIIFGVLIAGGILPSNINDLFVDGWQSVGMIIGIFALFSAVYPRLGYGTRLASAMEEPAKLDKEVVRFMEDRGYILTSDDNERMSFVHKNILQRVINEFCDEITFTRTLGGYDVEGRVKEVTRIIYAFGNRFSAAEDNAE